MAYGRLEAEASLETRPPHPEPPTDWPDKGGLEMEEVSFRYSEDYPLVLKSLSFNIKPSEKVGLLGGWGYWGGWILITGLLKVELLGWLYCGKHI